ncbi:MAG: c-type cytochrome [Bdellovibrionaceae bacterium]|nr:c-type cytochrome [Pseudobdellovibrionaceae bacterium]
MAKTDVNLDPYNRGGMWALLLSVGFSIIFFIWISFIHPGVNLNEIPVEVQKIIDAENQNNQDVDQVAAVAEVEEATGNPWVSSPAWIAKGNEVFKANCAVCHGNEGKGDGPGSGGMARNLVEGKWKAGGDSISLFKTIASGLSGTTMVGFGHIPVNDRWAIIQFIRSITNNKIKDNPKAVDDFAASVK